MKSYNILKLEYQNSHGKFIETSCHGVLLDNTEEFAGYWEFKFSEVIKGFSLHEGDSSIFIFKADKDICFIGEGKVQYDNQGFYSLIGKSIKLE